jgi:hypothetical protein
MASRSNKCDAFVRDYPDIKCGREPNHLGRHSARINMEWGPTGLVQFVAYVGYGSRRVRMKIKEYWA